MFTLLLLFHRHIFIKIFFHLLIIQMKFFVIVLQAVSGVLANDIFVRHIMFRQSLFKTNRRFKGLYFVVFAVSQNRRNGVFINPQKCRNIIADAPIEMMDAEEDVPASQISSSTMPQPAPASVTPSPKPISTTQPPQQTTPRSLDDYLNTMTLEDAKAVKVDCGYNAGKTLGEVAMRKPSDLDWYVQKYNGRNLALKAAAILLVNAAAQRAS